MLAFVRSIPATLRWVLLGAVLVTLAFVGGRCSAGKTVTETTTSTSVSTSASTSSSTSSSTATTDAQSAASTVVQTVYQNQATLRQDRDTDCTENFDPNTGKLVRRRCVTKTSTSSSSSSSGGSTASSSSSSSSSSSAHVDSTSVTSTSSSTVATTTTTKTETTGATSAFLSSKGLHLTVSAELGLVEDLKLVNKPSYSLGLSKDLFGPVSIGVTASTDKTLLASLQVDLGKDWAVAASAGARWTDLTKPFYGGSVDRRILGPVWVGVWGYSDRSGGISASITLP